MPRRFAPPAVAAPPPPPPLSPLVKRLRQDWRWAGISQFVYTFSDAFGLVDWDIEALEKDLDGAEDFVLPDLISKLLVALTWNRQINRQNAFENLRKQYIKRVPEQNPLGTLEEPVEWPALGLDQKVGILWQLCEWQLVDPARFRSLLKTEDDPASWRVDPIGWDKQGNTYFLFDDNRLWIQRARPLPPRPQKKSSQKAKKAQRAQRKANPPPKRSHKKREAPVPAAVVKSPPTTPGVPLLDASPIMTGSRKRKQVVFYGNVVPTVEALKRGGPTPTPTRSERATRRSSGRAPIESPTKSAPPLPLGTRVSKRLRAVDDDWQQVPKEWLNGSSSKSKAAGADDDSELSDLTDEETHDAIVQASLGSPVKEEPVIKSDSPLSDADHLGDTDEPQTETKGEPMDADQDEEDAPEDPEEEQEQEAEADDEEAEPDEFEEGLKHAKDIPEGFMEWETVCVTLDEWRTFPEQFAKSKHPDEKALYRILTNDVGPQIIEVLEAKEIERIKQEAINNRKRSSRIATRDLERAEMLRREQAEREMEERMDRLRQEEERKAREEAEAQEALRTREARLREREERIAARKQALVDRAEAEAHERERAERQRERRKRRREGEEVETSSDEELEQSAVPTPATTGSGQNSWELKCEVCQQHGWNLKDTDDLVGCDDCGRWQHVACHDKQDAEAGRRVRDWDKVDFRCKECEQRLEAKRRQIEEPRQSLSSSVPQPSSNQPGSATAQSLHRLDAQQNHTDRDPGSVPQGGPNNGQAQPPAYVNGSAGEHRHASNQLSVAPMQLSQHPETSSVPHASAGLQRPAYPSGHQILPSAASAVPPSQTHPHQLLNAGHPAPPPQAYPQRPAALAQLPLASPQAALSNPRPQVATLQGPPPPHESTHQQPLSHPSPALEGSRPILPGMAPHPTQHPIPPSLVNASDVGASAVAVAAVPIEAKNVIAAAGSVPAPGATDGNSSSQPGPLSK